MVVSVKWNVIIVIQNRYLNKLYIFSRQLSVFWHQQVKVFYTYLKRAKNVMRDYVNTFHFVFCKKSLVMFMVIFLLLGTNTFYFGWQQNWGIWSSHIISKSFCTFQQVGQYCFESLLVHIHVKTLLCVQKSKISFLLERISNR